MEEKDLRPGLRVKYPKTRFCAAGTGVVDENKLTKQAMIGTKGRVAVGIGSGSLFFDVKDLEVA